MSSRRKFLSTLPVLGAGVVLAHGNAAAGQAAKQMPQSNAESYPLKDGWQFRLDRDGTASAAEIASAATDIEVASVAFLSSAFSALVGATTLAKCACASSK